MRVSEENRLKNALDIDRTVDFDDSTHTYHPDFRWGTGDFEDAYPVLVLTYTQQAGAIGGEQPLNDVISFDERRNEPEFDINKGRRVRDLLQVTVAVDENRDDNGVPGHVKCHQLTESVWKQIRFALDFNSSGQNGERPMVFAVSDQPSGPENENAVVRGRFTLSADYTEVYTEVVDSVADADANVNFDQ